MVPTEPLTLYSLGADPCTRFGCSTAQTPPRSAAPQPAVTCREKVSMATGGVPGVAVGVGVGDWSEPLPTATLVANSEVSPRLSVAVAVSTWPTLTPLIGTVAWPLASALPEPTKVCPCPAGVCSPGVAAGASARKTSTVQLGQVVTATALVVAAVSVGPRIPLLAGLGDCEEFGSHGSTGARSMPRPASPHCCVWDRFP